MGNVKLKIYFFQQRAFSFLFLFISQFHVFFLIKVKSDSAVRLIVKRNFFFPEALDIGRGSEKLTFKICRSTALSAWPSYLWYVFQKS